MPSDYNRDIKLQALKNLAEKRKQDAQDSFIREKPKLMSSPVEKVMDSELYEDIPRDIKGMRVKGEGAIYTKEVLPQTPGKKFNPKIRQAQRSKTLKTLESAKQIGDEDTIKDALRRYVRKLGKSVDEDTISKMAKKFMGKGVKMLGAIGGPVLGALSALSTGDVSAAVPILGDVEEMGADPLLKAYETGKITKEQYFKEAARQQALQELKEKGKLGGN